MGDLIQMLPALTDAARAIPGVQFDWVVEESFKEIPSLHPNVNQIITLSYRRWKKDILSCIQNGEASHFLRQLRQHTYEMVIDTQSNLKSAFVTLLAKGIRHGLDRKSVHENGANLAYQKKFYVNPSQNHTHRMREMLAIILGYEQCTTVADYGIVKEQLPLLDFPLPDKFIFMTPITSRKEKLWPAPFWQKVIQEVLSGGYEIILPWGNHEERDRSIQLKNNNPLIHVLPSLDLSQKARVLSKATASISLDTGLAHMAAALDIPNVCLYGPTDPHLVGTIGKKQIHLTANGPACAPCLKTKCSYQGTSQYKPACLETITPQRVLDAFYRLL